MFIKILAVYLIVINIFSFILMGTDKAKAKRGAWRISEKMLFITALIGGSAGSILGMAMFRHKTKHKAFVIGMPLIFAAWLILAIVLTVLLKIR